MTGIGIGPTRAASVRPDATPHLAHQLFAELLRLATDLIKLPDEDLHTGEVRPFHSQRDCKLCSFRQRTPVRHAGAIQTGPQFNRTRAATLAGANVGRSRHPSDALAQRLRSRSAL